MTQKTLHEATEGVNIGPLVKAVCEVMKRVKNVEKRGLNAHFNYKFATAEDILAELQPVMAEHGLAILPTACEFSTTEAGTGGSGKVRYRTDLTMTYLLCHESGASVMLQVPGAGMDNEDKGIYKALTGAAKYMLCQAFSLPRMDDDPENTNGNGNGQPQIASAPPPPASQSSGSGAPQNVTPPNVAPEVVEKQSKNGKAYKVLANWQKFVDHGALLVGTKFQHAGVPLVNIEPDKLRQMREDAAKFKSAENDALIVGIDRVLAAWKAKAEAALASHREAGDDEAPF